MSFEWKEPDTSDKIPATKILFSAFLILTPVF